MQCSEKGPKEGKKKDQDGLGRNKHGRAEEKMDKKGWLSINKLLVSVFFWWSLSLHHRCVPHPLIKSYFFFVSADSTLSRYVWKPVNFKQDTNKRRSQDTSNQSMAANVWGSCLGASSRGGHGDLGQVLDKQSMQTCVCPCVSVCTRVCLLHEY